jgi:4-hydroxybenzoate polyprenyltransferase
MRPHHWVKNLLLFAAPLLLEGPFHVSWMGPATVAFIAFSLCASAAYLMNDVLDIDADRRHPKKCNRPFAAGVLPVSWAPKLAIGSLGLGLAAAATLSAEFAMCLLVYVALSSAYSVWLKPLVVVDVLALAALYTLRFLAGGIATGIPVSSWLLASCMLLFLSLALAKRHAELGRVAREGNHSPAGRAYVVGDLTLLSCVGQICGYLAGLVFAVYLFGGVATGVHDYEMMACFVCPLYLCWITRFWAKTRQGEALEDPVVFVLRDPMSVATGCGMILWLQIPAVV